MKAAAVLGCILIALFFFLTRIVSFSSSSSSTGLGETFVPNGPKVVIVTVLDEEFSDEYIQRIKQNREDYVARHGTWIIYT